MCDWYVQFGSVPETLMMTMFGGVVGTLLFSVMLAGWLGRSWLSGLTLGIASAGMTLALFLAGSSMCSHIIIIAPNTSGISAVFLVPTFMLCGATPFYALRQWRGCFLTHDPSKTAISSRGTEDLFVVTLVVAACLLFTRLPAAIWGARAIEFYAVFAVASGMFALLSLFSVFLWSLRVFTAKTPWNRLVIFFRGPLLFLLLFLVLARGWGMAHGQGLESIMYFVPGILSGSFVLGVGIWALHQSGCRLVWPSADKSKPKPTESSVRFDRIHNRWIAGALLLCAIGAGIVHGRIKSSRRSAWQEQNALSEQAVKLGGKIMLDESHQIVAVELGTAATDVSLERYSHLRHVKRISLADSSVSDACLQIVSSFPLLEDLDLSGTAITSASVPTLSGIQNLSRLSLAKTELSSTAVLEIVEAESINDLDVSEMRLTEEELRRIAERHRGSLAIRGYDFDDDAVSRILAEHDFEDGVVTKGGLWSLDLSGNRIRGSCLKDIDVTLYNLKLHDAALSDDVFGPVAEKLKVARLHLANTELTDSFLASFEKAMNITGLHLGPGQISEQGLGKLQRVQLRYLTLNASQFTGECFRTWKPQIRQLDMSGSGLSDATVGYLANLTNCRIMDFSNTGITDAALRELGKLTLYKLNLADTAITADGLSRGNLKNASRVDVAFGQFTDQEIRRIRDAGVALNVGGARFPSSSP